MHISFYRWVEQTCGRNEDVPARQVPSADHGAEWANFGEPELFDVFELGGGNLKPCILDAICKHEGRTALITRND